MDIGAWLRGLGLEIYETAFEQNSIDEQVLPYLTQEDLKEIGVTPVGHRRLLLRAIGSLLEGIDRVEGTAGPTPSLKDKAAGSDQAPSESLDLAEWRQVTVMFADLVGSTALSGAMDPEDLRQVIAAYQRSVARSVQRFGGYVAKYMGDGVLVYFGYPTAHEDDPERALRAGLDVVATVGALETCTELRTRVGIATGLVVVGDLIGAGPSQEHAIVGETPNLAARLQGIADPNSVVIADSTRRLVGDLFELTDLGGRSLTGIVGPNRAWKVLEPRSVESRFDALHSGSLSELVGRQEEVDLLLRRWSKAQGGEGQVVLLSGEAGIGKSRLIAALLKHLASVPHARMRAFCSPQYTDSALYPVIGQLERAAGLSRDDSASEKLDKLDSLLAESSTTAEDAAVIADLLSLSNDGRHATLDVPPQQRREMALQALVTRVSALSRATPLLITLEDVHWTDPTTLELLGRVVEAISALRVLLVITFRQEFEPPWVGRSHVTLLTLNRLNQRDVGSMIDSVPGSASLPCSIRQDIINRTDGIPLFIEEMTRAVLEARDEEAAARTLSAVPSSSHPVPASLHASLMARLDRLGPAKEIAQLGATIGREFALSLLAAVLRRPEHELEAALDRIVRAGLFFRQGVPPHLTYLFKHALIQDAAYSSLLRDPRRALHARIVEALERDFPDIAEAQPEIVARHCAAAGFTEKAAAAWGKAGQRSLERSALVEGTTQLSQCLELLSTLPGSPARRREQIRFQIALIAPLIHIRGYAAPETRAATERARLLIDEAERLGEQLEDPLLLFSVLYGSWYANLGAFNGDALHHIAKQFLNLAEEQGSTIPLMIGHRLVGSSTLHTGDFRASQVHFGKALSLYDPESHGSLAFRFGQDIQVSILAFRSITMWVSGYPAAALSDVDQVISVARQSGHAPSLIYALAASSVAQLQAGNFAAVIAQNREAVALAEETHEVFWHALGMILQGHATTMEGNAEAGIHDLTTGFAAYRSIGATVWLPQALTYLATAHLELRDIDEASRLIGEAIDAVEISKECWFEAEVHRTAGEIALRASPPDEAKAELCFQRAIAVAQAQEAKSWELRSARSLARLWGKQAQQEKALELLQATYSWFSEGFDTKDLREARALLRELSAPLKPT